MVREKDQVAAAIRATLESPNVPDSNMEPANVVDVIQNLADAIDRHTSCQDGAHRVAEAGAAIAQSIHRLGNADAATPMGGLEALGKCLLDSAERIAQSIDGLARAINTGRYGR